MRARRAVYAVDEESEENSIGELQKDQMRVMRRSVDGELIFPISSFYFVFTSIYLILPRFISLLCRFTSFLRQFISFM